MALKMIINSVYIILMRKNILIPLDFKFCTIQKWNDIQMIERTHQSTPSDCQSGRVASPKCGHSMFVCQPLYTYNNCASANYAPPLFQFYSFKIVGICDLKKSEAFH